MRRSLWVAVAILVALPAPAQAPIPLEHQIKATFLYTIAKFIQCPPEKLEGNGLIGIGVFGKDKFGGALERQVQGKSVEGRGIAVRRLTGIEQAPGQHILFIGASEKRQLGAILGSLTAGGVLTVGDIDRFAEQGGMVNLVMKGNSVSLEINTGAAERGQIKISSKLLKLARVVADRGRR